LIFFTDEDEGFTPQILDKSAMHLRQLLAHYLNIETEELLLLLKKVEKIEEIKISFPLSILELLSIITSRNDKKAEKFKCKILLNRKYRKIICHPEQQNTN